MKIHTLLLLAPLLILSTCSRSKQQVQSSSQLNIVVSIPPQKYFVEKIGGDRVAVTTLIPAGASPHTFEPKPSSMAAVADADCWFSIGLEIEDAWIPKLQQINSGLKIVATDSGIVKMRMAEHDGEAPGDENGLLDHRCHEHEGLDPHIWLAPALVKQQIRHITSTLCLIDSAHATFYRKRHARFDLEIDSLTAAITTKLARCDSGRTFLVFHPSWGYFAHEFSLHELAIEVEGKEPGLREMGSIVAQARSNNITTLLIQPQFSQKLATTIAKQIGAQVGIADPMAEAWGQNLLSVAESICK